MSLNGLTGSAGLKLGPLVLETLVKHYFERLTTSQKIPTSTSSDGDPHDGKQGGTLLTNNLRQEELLYDQAFSIVKEFLSTASRHTVEELQQFSNTRTPSPPWVKVLRVVVPMSCCDQAAGYLIEALGGEAATKEIVGGTKWWQIRGVNGVDGEWIVAKKDWQEAKKRAKFKEHREKSKERKEREKSFQQPNTTDTVSGDDASEPGYTPDMDEQRCILYFHGGGYYFGSVDQERYSIQRFARKMNGRVFAINYRLSPQYPFPCAIQDAIAAYLYLIRPPPEAQHKPVKPQHIVIMGDSAGGGLSLAALQVIRDSGLPQCAGGVLISPWCDLTHSFPSIHANTKTDVIPYYGLSMHKPSILWPPPGKDDSHELRQSIRRRIRDVAGLGDHGPLKSFLGSRGRTPIQKGGALSPNQTVDAGNQGDLSTSTSVPNVAYGQDQCITMEMKDGGTLNVDSQIQFYAPNNLLSHPLISHCRAYLGGLPPLFFMAGEQEVLRDEIIYTAHRAANPSKFPIHEDTKRLYPKIADFAAKYPVPTKVHLQVYDGCAHVLPILFAFATPAKYCFRAIASFCRFATGMQAFTPGPSSPGPGSPTQGNFFGGSFFTAPPEEVGDLTERRRKSWWGGERDPSLTRKATKADKKTEKERQRLDKEKSAEEFAKVKKGGSDGQVDVEDKAGKVEVKTELNSEVKGGVKGEEVDRGVKSDGTNGRIEHGAVENPEFRGQGEIVAKAEVVSEVEVATNVSPPVGGNQTDEAPVADNHFKTEIMMRTETGKGSERSLREAKSLRSIGSSKSTKESRGSTKLKKRWSLMIGKKSAPDQISIPTTKLTEDVAGPRFEVVKEPEGERCAGDYPPIYESGFDEKNFIRERVSIRGVIRPLEPEAQLPAFALGENLVGTVCESSLRRYLQGKNEFDHKFSGTLRGIEKARDRNLKLAIKEGDKSMGHLRTYLQKVTERSDSGLGVLDSPRFEKTSAGSWNWSWALDEDEHPPPSSIVSRRDTREARQLAMIADVMPEGTMSGNNLWQHLVTFLTATPDKKTKTAAEREHPKPEAGEQEESDWTNISNTSTTTEVNVQAQVQGATQANGAVPAPGPLDLVSVKTRPHGWLFWTRGSLWKEKFRVSHFSKTHRRSLSSASTIISITRTASTALP